MVARGAKRPRSELRGLLQGFQPLLLSWSGQHELKTLLRAEWRGGLPLVGGSALVCGFYLNELLLKLLPREDPHPRLFASYEAALADLAAGGEQAPVLRRFELALLAELGYALPLVREADTGAPIDPGGTLPLRLRSRAAARAAGARRRGCRSCAARRCSRSPTAATPTRETAAEAKRLMREVLDHYLEQRGVESRRVVQDLQALDGSANRRTTAVIELGVNIDHVATLRQARRTYEPDPVWAAVEAHLGGADGITVHLREDRRHIQDEDVRRLRELVHIKLNLEMAATAEMVDIAVRLKPEMAMLVPEGRHEITTEGGLDVAAQEAKLGDAVDAARRRRHRDQRVHRRRARGRSRPRRASAPRSARSTPDRMRTRSTRRVAIRRAPPVVAELGEDPRGGRGHPRSRECASMPGTRSTISTCSRSRRCPACASCTSATRSSRARSSSACARRCGR